MITMLSYAQIVALLVVCFVYYFHRRRSCQNPIVFDWPFFGMVPSMIPHLRNLHEYITDALNQQACTTNFRGPWFTKLNYLVTCDPINVQHIKCKNSDNYLKGPEFRDNFDILGDGIITSESETWKYSRTLLHSLLKDKNFDKLCEKVVHQKIQSGLFPVLDDVIINVRRKEQGIVDLQDIFKRFNFDYFCSIFLGHDPRYLAIEFPELVVGKALTEVEKCVFYRHTKPKSLWKLQRWLGIGAEKKLAAAFRAFDQFLYQHIASKREDHHVIKRREINNQSNEELEAQADFLTNLMREEKRNARVHGDRFIKDTIANLLIAGRETLTSALTWFFWLVATHPYVEAKIIEEIKEKIVAKGQNPSFLGVEEVKNLVYLHGAICESLRLFPPISLDFRQAIKSDVLPSGHNVDANSMILFSYYSMGRLEKLWGKDYLEFKPERWISDTGGIVYVPFHKFATFGTGPRICLGRNMSLITLKIVASAILWNYHVQVVKDHPVSPTVSIVIMMKRGLKVELAKRR